MRLICAIFRVSFELFSSGKMAFQREEMHFVELN